MGYGSRSLDLLQQYYEGKFPNLKESDVIETDKNEDSEEESDDAEEAKQVDDEVSEQWVMCDAYLCLSCSSS